MGLGFGIAALVFAIISLFVPFAGFFIALFALGLAVVSAACGNKPFVIASGVIATISAVMSPAIWGLAYNKREPYLVGVFFLLLVVFSIAPYVTIFIRSRVVGEESDYPTSHAPARRVEPHF